MQPTRSFPLFVAAFTATACVVPRPSDATANRWLVSLGLPTQEVDLAALPDLPTLATPAEREAWLALRPRVVVDASFANFAVPFGGPDLVSDGTARLESFFDDGDEGAWIQSSDPEGTSGLDHNVSFTVRLATDVGEVASHWVAFNLVGDPGCGGDKVPLEVTAFDADRAPLQWDGETVGVAGVQVAVVIPEHDCVVPM